MENKEQDWYFTFGYGHDPGIGYYAVFHGTYNSAREKMVAAYGLKWCFQYPSAEAAGVEKYGLINIHQGYNKIIKGDELRTPANDSFGTMYAIWTCCGGVELRDTEKCPVCGEKF